MPNPNVQPQYKFLQYLYLNIKMCLCDIYLIYELKYRKLLINIINRMCIYGLHGVSQSYVLPW